MDSRLTDAMQGLYRYSMRNVFDEAWERIKGFKTTYWAALGIIILICFGLFGLCALLVGMIGIYTGGVVGEQLHLVTPLEKAIEIPMPMFISLIVFTLVALFFILPLIAGLWMLAINYVSRQPIQFSMVFSYFHKPHRFLLAYIWTTIIIQIGNLVGSALSYKLLPYGGGAAYWGCVVLGLAIQIYALISYFFVLPLLADKKLGTWNALETCRKAIAKHWFKVFFSILTIILVCGIIPGFVIGLMAGTIHRIALVFLIIFIWLVPFYSLCTAIVYREIFGTAATAENLPKTTV